MTVNYTLQENKGQALNGEVAYIGQFIWTERGTWGRIYFRP